MTRSMLFIVTIALGVIHMAQADSGTPVELVSHAQSAVTVSDLDRSLEWITDGWQLSRKFRSNESDPPWV